MGGGEVISFWIGKKWRAFVVTAVNVWVSWNFGKFLNGWYWRPIKSAAWSHSLPQLASRPVRRLSDLYGLFLLQFCGGQWPWCEWCFTITAPGAVQSLPWTSTSLPAWVRLLRWPQKNHLISSLNTITVNSRLIYGSKVGINLKSCCYCRLVSCVVYCYWGIAWDRPEKEKEIYFAHVSFCMLLQSWSLTLREKPRLRVFENIWAHRGSRRAGLWYPSSRVQTRPKPSDFSGEKKILSTPSFWGEVKPSVPRRKLKRTQKWRGSRHFRQNSRKFLSHSSTFRCWGSLASFQTWGTPGGGSWNVLIAGPQG